MRAPPDPARRSFLKLADAGGLAAALSVPEAEAAPSQAAWLFFNRVEAAFVNAACARLIPEQPTGPGALEARVPQFIDRQLAGA